MPLLKENELKQQIKQGEFLPAYFFSGEETFLCQHYAEEIAKKSVPAESTDFNLFRFNGREDQLDLILETCEAFPLMAERKCVLVCDLDPEALRADDTKKLKAYLQDPPAYTTLVFWYDSVQIGSKKTAKQKSVFELVKKCGGAAEFARKDAASLVRLLVGAAKARGKTLPPAVAGRLVELAGDDLQLLQSEIEKLCAYSRGEEITVDDVDAVASHTLDASVFDIAKAILRKDSARAFSLLDELFLQKAEPVVIFGVLCNAFADIYRAKVCLDEGQPAESAAQYYQYRGREFRLRNAARDAKALTAAQIETCLNVLDEADGMLKASAVDNHTALEKTVAGLLLAVSGGKR